MPGLDCEIAFCGIIFRCDAVVPGRFPIFVTAVTVTVVTEGGVSVKPALSCVP